MLWKVILLDPWWRWQPLNAGWGDRIYHWFNLMEAAVWFICAAAVLWRTQPRSYGVDYRLAAALVIFGISDVVEAWFLSLPLAAVKLLVLIALLRFRRRRSILRRDMASV
jgi:hypothetical protein